MPLLPPFPRLRIIGRLRCLFAVCLAVLGSPGHAQTFSSGRIDYGDGSSNVFSVLTIGPDGKFYVFWKDGNYVNPVTQTIPSFKLLRWETTTSTWTAVSTITTNTATIPNMYVNPVADSFTMLGDRFGMKIDSLGQYHIVFQPYLKPAATIMGAVVYGFSANGTSWTFTPLEDSGGTTNYSFSDPQIELDQNQRPHVVFRVSDSSSSDAAARPTRIRHYAFNGTSWAGETVYSRTGSFFAINGGIGYALDSAGKVHIAIGVETNGSGTDASLFYLNNVSGSWSAPVNLAAGATAAAAVNSSGLDLVVDANDKVHIVSRDQVTKIYYHTNKSGSWVGGQINGSMTGFMDEESLTVNDGGDLLLVFNNQPSTSNLGAVSYAALLSGATTWNTGSVFSGSTNTGRFSAVAFSNTRVAMMTFDHYTGTLTPANNPDRPRELEYATATFAPPGPSAPVVSTPTSASITMTAATLGGNVSGDGGATVTARGVVYAATASNNNPAIGGSGVVNLTATGTTGVFTVNASGLNQGTGYSYKAYATNSVGTSYTSTTTFTTTADTTPPTVVSVVRQTPLGQNLSSGTSSATFRVTYSEAVTGVAAARFAVEAVNGASLVGSITSVTSVSTSVYDVVVALTSGSGEFRLSVID